MEKLTYRRRLYCVTYNTLTKDVSCDGRKFETFGILCKYRIRVLDQNLVFEIPQKYILDRWRKDIVRKHTRVKVPYYDPYETLQFQKFNCLMSQFESICDEASTANEEMVELVLQRLTQLADKVKKRKGSFQEKQVLPPMPKAPIPPSEIGLNNPCSNTQEGQHVTLASVTKPSSQQTNVAIKDPKTRKKPCGRPKSTRYKSLAETGYNNQKAKQKTVVEPTQQKKPVKRKLSALDEYVCQETPYSDHCVDIAADDDQLVDNFVAWSSPSKLF